MIKAVSPYFSPPPSHTFYRCCQLQYEGMDMHDTWNGLNEICIWSRQAYNPVKPVLNHQEWFQSVPGKSSTALNQLTMNWFSVDIKHFGTLVCLVFQVPHTSLSSPHSQLLLLAVLLCRPNSTASFPLPFVGIFFPSGAPCTACSVKSYLSNNQLSSLPTWSQPFIMPL